MTRTSVSSTVFHASWVSLFCSLALAPLAHAQSASYRVICIADSATLASTPDPQLATLLNADTLIASSLCRKDMDLTVRDTLTLVVRHAPEVDFNDQGEPNPQDLVLYLNGKPIPGTHPQIGRSATNEENNVTTTLLSYRFTPDLRSADARTNWGDVLAAANNGENIAVSTGVERGAAAVSGASVRLNAYAHGWLLGWGIGFVLGMVVFFWVLFRTGALRDKEPDDPQHPLQPQQRAYSLARVQMAMWTMLVVYGYFFIWMLTANYNGVIPASMVALMGLSAASFGVAAGIDAANVSSNLEKAATASDATNGPSPEEYRRRATVAKSQGILNDLFTSADGAALHRIQFAVWSVVMMVIYVVSVMRNVAMPDFDATMLALTGITAGAYVGVKVPENKK